MVFGRTHALLATASLLQVTSASSGWQAAPVAAGSSEWQAAPVAAASSEWQAAPVAASPSEWQAAPAGEITITKTITNTHTVCPATTKPAVCKPTDVAGGFGNGHGSGSGNGNGNGNGNGWGSGNDNGNGNANGYHGGDGQWGSGRGPQDGVGNEHNTRRPHSPQEAADIWQSWLDKMSSEANHQPTASAHVPWYDWQTATATDGSKPHPTGKPPAFDGECTKPGQGLPENKCNAAGSRSKWCDGKSIDSDYYQEYDSGKTCRYNFEITNTTLTFDKGPVMSFAINGQSPGPVIECNWGDWVEINVINKLENNATAIHWHGIHQKGTNDQDGVPGISECALAPGDSRTYAWRASSYGTAWYHSHLLAQYADGIRGPIIIHGPATAEYDVDMGHVMISDNFPAGTAFAQADRIAHFGQAAVGTSNYLLNGNNKDITLTTGKHALWTVQKGKKHLFRFINGAAQDAYSVHLDGHKMKVIAADFVPIEPYETEWLNIVPGQRYDVIVEANQASSNYFLRAVTQTGCPSVPKNNGLGLANGIVTYTDAVLTMPNSTFGNRTAQSFAICKDEPLEKLVPHLKKSAGSAGLFTAGQKALPAGSIAQPSANRSVVQWFLNNNFMNVSYSQPTLQTLAQNPSFTDGVAATNSSGVISNSIVLGQKDTWVYFIIRNQFFAAHPLHLHGHDLSLLGQGNGEPDVSKMNFDNPTRRDTFMLQGSSSPNAPGGATLLGYSVIGFQTDNPGAWLMHCHIVWHVDGGMALQFIEAPHGIQKYANKPEFQKECKNLNIYEQNPANRKDPNTSGVKRNIEEMFGADVVRRDISRHAHRHI